MALRIGGRRPVSGARSGARTRRLTHGLRRGRRTGLHLSLGTVGRPGRSVPATRRCSSCRTRATSWTSSPGRRRMALHRRRPAERGIIAGIDDVPHHRPRGDRGHRVGDGLGGARASAASSASACAPNGSLVLRAAPLRPPQGAAPRRGRQIANDGAAPGRRGSPRRSTRCTAGCAQLRTMAEAVEAADRAERRRRRRRSATRDPTASCQAWQTDG